MMTVEPDSLAKQILSGNRRALAQAITLVESTRSDDRLSALKLLELLLPHTGNSIRLGISGIPGVGKSTFIEAIGNHIIDQGHRIAVLTIDPSSMISGGSILGDKTRMDSLSRNNSAYIRPSPSKANSGGVSRRTRESILLCEAAGFDVILVETVGVGQTETQVSEMTDMFILLMQPGTGDELQGIKRGIMELADLILINKADGELVKLAERAKADYMNALRLLHAADISDSSVAVMTCSSRDQNGLAEAWECILSHNQMLRESGKLELSRSSQSRDWLWAEVKDGLLQIFNANENVLQRIPTLESDVMTGRTPPTVAAQQLIELFLSSEKSANIARGHTND